MSEVQVILLVVVIFLAIIWWRDFLSLVYLAAVVVIVVALMVNGHPFIAIVVGLACLFLQQFFHRLFRD